MEVILPESVSTHIWRYGFFEADVCFFLLETLNSGMVFLDVGAHFGFFSLLAGHLIGPRGRVVSVEPMPKALEQLTRNTANHCTYRNTSIVQCAAYSTTTRLEFHDFGLVYAAFNSAFSPRKAAGFAKSSPTVSVEARTGDSIVRELKLPRVDVVKIDAESSEIRVLQGMEEVIARHGPRIILEVGDFDLLGVPSSSELVHWLQLRGYFAYEEVAGKLAPHIDRNRYNYGNLLFVRR